VAQSANQVLSKVLSDPPDLLSVRPTCCQFAQQNSRSLRGLLISFLALLGQFDGEEGFDAGMQVEGFAGPAGSDA
jgi:hypothetical protein